MIYPVAVLAALLAFFAAAVSAADWVVLVAGSNGYYNYRHQADVSAAYTTIIKANNIPASNIIVMMYDDIANNPSNPYPGKLFNWQDDSGKLGPDVYTGIVKDYTAATVTPEIFLKVLQGQKPGVGSNKVVASTANDNIFVFFSDHGGPGILAFPSEYLSSTDLNNAISAMGKAKRFKQMVFYVEACESGSMFDNILTTPNVYALTASDPTTSSYACEFNNALDAYLNDCFSFNWMQAVRDNDSGSQTFMQNYITTRNLTTESTACAYGDLAIQSELMASFIGKKSSSSKRSDAVRPASSEHAVSSRQTILRTIERRLLAATSSEQKMVLMEEYNQQLRMLRRAETIFASVRSHLNIADERPAETSNDTCHATVALNHACIHQSIHAFMDACPGLVDDYVLDEMYTFRNLCSASSVPAATFEELRSVLSTACAAAW